NFPANVVDYDLV
ncbi:hypothetical protein JL09_g6753, partial [Pichia kudriavzevii]